MTKAQAQQLAAWTFGPACLLFLVWVFWLGPNELAPQQHKVLGLFAALAAGFLGYFISGLIGLGGTVSLPVFGRVKVNAVGGAAMFVLVLLWWRSDHSPVKEVLEEISTLTDQMAASVKALDAYLEAKRIGEDPSQRTLPPGLEDAAKLVRERGTKKEKIKALIVLGKHAEADVNIQELKKAEFDEAFDVAMLEGDNKYDAGNFNGAIEPYAQALALRPNDPQARNSLAIAHGNARLGDVPAHRKRAVELLEENVRQARHGSREWVKAQVNLGAALSSLPTADRAGDLKKSIEASKAALAFCSPTSDAEYWAAAQSNLGAAHADLPTGDGATGDRAKNLHEAIEHYTQALKVYGRESKPSEWARTRGNMGVVWSNVPNGNPSENLTKAIDAHRDALQVFTQGAHPDLWANTQNNLGTALRDLQTGDRPANLRAAVAAHEAALKVYTRQTHPEQWAGAQFNLASAWQDMPDPAENLPKAVEAFEEVLDVYTRERFPVRWAATQHNLGIALQALPTGDRAHNVRRAIAAYEAALEVRTREADPIRWAMTKVNLGAAWMALPDGDRKTNLTQAVDALTSAQQVYTESAHPVRWATVQHNLAIVNVAFTRVPGEERCARLASAERFAKSTLKVRTADALPQDLADSTKLLHLIAELSKSFGCDRRAD